MPRVLITGSEHPAGLAALRALDRAGFETWVAVHSPTSLGARSRVAAGRVEVSDPRTAPDAFVSALADAAKRLGAAAVLPGTEAALLALAGRENAFPDAAAIGTPPETVVRRATDKTELAPLSLRAGLEVPPTRVVARQGPVAMNELYFPAILKPLRSELMTHGQLGRFDAKRVESPAELERALRVLPDEVGLVQDCIEGPLISVNGVAFEGKLHGVNQHVVHRVWPDHCGQAVYAETIPMVPERERAAAAFIKELGWSGIFNLQLIERDGRNYVIDFNPRFYASMALAAAAGLNLPAIWTSLLLGLPFEARSYRAGVHFRDEKGDPRAIFRDFRRGQLGVARGLLPRRRTVHSLFSIRDPRPGLSIVGDLVAALRRRFKGGAPEPAPSRPPPAAREKTPAGVSSP
jgi:predicted ATP-grasp superfamily ATP-dependent carboligase